MGFAQTERKKEARFGNQLEGNVCNEVGFAPASVRRKLEKGVQTILNP
jgi:hypothetical protein